MRLTTYNLNGIRARLPRLLEWLEREQSDVVCLQELKCADDALPIADIEAAGYGAVWHGQKLAFFRECCATEFVIRAILVKTSRFTRPDRR